MLGVLIIFHETFYHAEKNPNLLSLDESICDVIL